MQWPKLLALLKKWLSKYFDPEFFKSYIILVKILLFESVPKVMITTAKIGACLAHVATISRNVNKGESLIQMVKYLNQFFFTILFDFLWNKKAVVCDTFHMFISVNKKSNYVKWLTFFYFIELSVRKIQELKWRLDSKIWIAFKTRETKTRL